MPLRMTPNFEDLSCEFAFGQDALPAEEDPLMQEVRHSINEGHRTAAAAAVPVDSKLVHRLHATDVPHKHDSPEDCHHFIGFACWKP